MESEFTYRSYLGVPGTLIKLWVWLFKQVVHVLGSHERFPQRLNDNEIYYIYENLLLSQFNNFLKEENEVSWAHLVLREPTSLLRVCCLCVEYFRTTYKPSVKKFIIESPSE